MPVSNHTPAKFLWRIHSPIAAKREKSQQNDDLAETKINFNIIKERKKLLMRNAFFFIKVSVPCL